MGGRYDARKLRMVASNAAIGSDARAVLDSSGIERVSFSFADELVRKLVDECGFLGFSKAFKTENTSDECASVIDYVTGQYGDQGAAR